MIYSVTANPTSVSTSYSMRVASSAPHDAVTFELLEARIHQTTRYGDTQRGAVSIQCERFQSTSVTGSVAIVEPFSSEDLPGGFLFGRHSNLAYTPYQTVWVDSFNLQNGFVWRSSPERRIVQDSGPTTRGFVVIKIGAPPAAINMHWTFLVRVIAVNQ